MRARCKWLTVAGLLFLVWTAPQAWAQTSDAPAAKSTTDDSGQSVEPASDEDLYILRDVSKPVAAEPKLDLGTVGEKGKLTFERMRSHGGGAYDDDGRGKRPRGAGVRLRFPLGKQGK